MTTDGGAGAGGKRIPLAYGEKLVAGPAGRLRSGKTLPMDAAGRAQGRRANGFKASGENGDYMADPLDDELKKEAEERRRLERKEWTRAEVLEHLKGVAPDFDERLAAMLRVPEKLYRAPGGVFELNEKPGRSNAGMASEWARAGRKEALQKIDTYSLGFIDQGSHSYFFLTDPSRKFVLMEIVESMMDGFSSWKGVARALEKAVRQ